MKGLSDLKKVVKVYYSIVDNKHIALGSFLFYSISSLLAAVILPIYFKRVIDSLAVMDYSVWDHVVVFCLVIFVIRISFYIADKCNVAFESKAEKKIYEYSFSVLSGQSYNFFASNFSGGLVAKSNRFASSFTDMFDQFSLTLVPATVTIAGIVISMFVQNVYLGLGFLVWSILHILLTLVLVNKKIDLSLKVANKQSQITACLADYLTNAFTVISFGSQKYEINLFRKNTKQFKRSRDKEWNYLVKMFFTLAGSVNILTVVSMIGGVYLVLDGVVSLGVLVLIFSYSSTLFRYMVNISKAIDKMSKHLANALEMTKILEAPIEIIDHPHAKALTINNPTINFNQVTFNYTGQGDNEIHDLSLHIPSGQSVGLVGPSGAGKSTITKLLLRFIDPDQGSITIDQQDIKQVTQESLRQSISYVPQQPLLFHRSLYDNISYGKPDVSLDEVIEAAKKANAHEFIQFLPQGYDTLVGERGVKLSGGQRQRVAIARAILKDAPILILDEATSSLDSKSEKLIQEAINNLIDEEKQEGRTVIVIAHRLSTIKHLDRIIVLDQGQVKQDSSHDELIKQPGLYQELWEVQG